MRRAARTDANKPEIVDALRAAGFAVYDLRLPVDLAVGMPGGNLFMEIKDGQKVPSARKLTDLQARFMATWPGPFCVVDSPEAAVRAARAYAATIMETHAQG